MSEEICDALYRKAIGFSSEEEVREYSSEDELIKRKVTVKNVPPDTAAAKAYMEIDTSFNKFKGMTEKQLIAEAKKIFKEIKEIQIDGD